MEYLRLSKQYLKENKKFICLLILSIAIGVSIIFSFQVAKRSQAINNMNYIKEVSPTFDSEAINLDFETTQKIKSNSNVKSVRSFKNLGEFIENKNGKKMILREYNEDIISSYKLELIDGRMPRNSSEIVVTVDKLSIDNYKIGNSINGYIKKEYSLDGKHKLYMAEKSFKVVGLISPKSNKNDLFRTTYIYANIQDGENLIPKEAIGYDSHIDLKTGLSNLNSNVTKLINDLGESQNTILANETYERLREEVSSGSIDDTDLDKIVLASALFVFSMFSLFMRKRLKDIGLVRIIGGSKRGLSISIIFENILIAFIGCIIGLVIGYLMAIYLNKHTTLTGTFDYVSSNRKLFVKSIDVIMGIKISLISVLISTIIPLIAINFTSGLDLIKNKNCFDKLVENLSMKKSPIYFIKKLTTKLAFQNFSRNFLSMLISILVVAIVSGRWIDVLSVYKMMDKITPTNDITRFQSRNSEIYKDTYSPTYGIKETDVEKLKNLNGVTNILELKQLEGYGLIDEQKLSDDFKSNPDSKNDINEVLFTISGYDKSYFKDKDIFSSGGYKQLDNEELSVIITDSFYDRYDGSRFKNMFKDLKVGDIIQVKLPVIEESIETYKTFDVKVIGVLNTKWENYKDAPSKFGELIFDIDKLQDITNSDTYTSLKFDISEDTKSVENTIKATFSSDEYKINNVDDLKKEKLEIQEQFKQKLALITIFFMIVAFVNMYCNIKGNLMLRRKEFSTLRAVGASKKLIYNMICKESLIYSVICGSLGPLYGILKSYAFYLKSTKSGIDFIGFSELKFEFPTLEVFLFFTITVIFCFITVKGSLKSILKENIVDGIRSDD